MPQWLRKRKWMFSDYRWYRKWYGGSWTQWVVGFDVMLPWLPSSEKCGCALYPLKVENWV